MKRFRSIARFEYAERGLWLLAIALALAFNAIKVNNWLTVADPAEHSDFAVFYMAALVGRTEPLGLYAPETWQATTGLDLYVGGPYVYLPSFAWLISPMTLLPYDTARWLWFWINAAAAALCVFTMTRIWPDRRIAWAGGLCWLILPSTLDTLYLGNINLMLALLITVGLSGFMRSGRGSQMIGGAMVGIAAGLKLFPAVLFVPSFWGWDKRSYAFGFVAAVLLFGAVGWISMPPVLWWQYAKLTLTTSQSLAPSTLSPLWNQSIWAFWDKLSYGGDLALLLAGERLGTIDVQPILSSELARTLGGISALALASVTVITFVRVRSRQPREYTIIWALFLLFSLLASPVAWIYYAAVMAPVLPAILEARTAMARFWRALLPLGYILIVAQRGMILLLERIPTMLFSSLMFMGLLLWWLAIVYRLVWPSQPRALEAA